MSQLNDCIFDALRSQGYTGHHNDMMLAWAKDNGATSNQLNEAVIQALIANGATTQTYIDAWFEALIALGYSGSTGDMLTVFWCTDGGALALRAISGWTALVDCGATTPDVCTVHFNKEAIFTDPDIGWTFTKTSAGRQLVTDIEFDNALVDGAPPLDGNWYNPLSSPANYTLGGKLYIASGEAIVTLAKETLEANKDYNVVVDIDEPASGFALSVALGGSIVSGNINTAGVHAITVTTEGTLTNNNIGIVNLGTPEIIVNSISVIEDEGVTENITGVDVVSATASPAEDVVFTLNWANDPTYLDTVVASYDSTTGDYEELAFHSELSPDPLMEGGHNDDPWEHLAGAASMNGTEMVIGIGGVLRTSANEAYIEGESYRAVIECGTITTTGVRFLVNQVGIVDLIASDSDQVVTIDFVMGAVVNQFLAFSSVVTGGTGVFKSATLKRRKSGTKYGPECFVDPDFNDLIGVGETWQLSLGSPSITAGVLSLPWGTSEVRTTSVDTPETDISELQIGDTVELTVDFASNVGNGNLYVNLAQAEIFNFITESGTYRETITVSPIGENLFVGRTGGTDFPIELNSISLKIIDVDAPEPMADTSVTLINCLDA